MSMTPEFQARIERDFAGLMRDHMGSGYVPEFYSNEAGPFVAACKSFVNEALEAAQAELAGVES